MRNAGFTILEILIALAITAILGTMVAATFISQQNTYQAQNMISRTDSRLRRAMDFLQREVSNAGYGFDVNWKSYGAGGYDNAPGNPMMALEIWQGDPATGQADIFSVTYMSPDFADQFMVNFADGDQSFRPAKCDTQLLRVREVPSHQAAAGRLAQGDAIVCYNPVGTIGAGGASSYAFTVAGGFDGVNLAVSINTQPDYTAVCTDSLPELVCAPAMRHSFYIDDVGSASAPGPSPGTAENPILMMATRNDFDPNTALENAQDIPIALNIENVQIDLCTARRDCEAAGWFSPVGAEEISPRDDPSLANEGGIVSVTLRVTARSARQARLSDGSIDPNFGDPPLFLDGRNLGTFGTQHPGGPNAYLRRTASTEIHLPNAKGAYLRSQLGSSN